MPMFVPKALRNREQAGVRGKSAGSRVKGMEEGGEATATLDHSVSSSSSSWTLHGATDTPTTPAPCTLHPAPMGAGSPGVQVLLWVTLQLLADASGLRLPACHKGFSSEAVLCCYPPARLCLALCRGVHDRAARPGCRCRNTNTVCRKISASRRGGYPALRSTASLEKPL
ncbi:hypothetical protein CRUP_003423 [Coryphaenoides rupestris]|nr:hypothetical protein CRUP_003423 [Coryphaenoides rupestris]